MKLLYVIHQFFPDCFSGTEQYCLAAAREARRRGDEVVVLSLVPDYGRDDPPLLVTEDAYDDFRVIRLRHWWGLQPNEVLRDYENPLIAARFAQILAAEAPRAVHFFHLRNLGSDLIDAARDQGIRTVVNLMDYWYLCPRFTLLRSDGALCEGPPEGGLGCIQCQYPRLAAWAEAELHGAVSQFAGVSSRVRPGSTPAAQVDALMRRKDVQLARLARADTIVAPSRFLADMFARNGFPTDRMQVVPYGLEPGRVRRSDVQRPRSPLRIGFAGVLSPWKAPHLAIDAVRQIEEPIQLNIHGRTEEPMFADYINGLREGAAGDDRITFSGPFDRSGLDQVMADLDLLVVPSTWYENTPFVILEALEAGVPVIASNLGGMSEVIVEGENGYLFENGDAGSLAKVLRRCASDPHAVAALRPNPPGSIAENYDCFHAAYGGANGHSTA